MLTTCVTFYMLGARCETRFDNVAEALRWVEIVYNNGCVMPIAVQGGTNDDSVRYSGRQLIEMMNI